MKKFDQYVSHLRILSRAFDEDLTNDFIVSGIIDKYYIQFELGWKVLKELLRYEGANQAATGSPREIIKTAYAYYDFIDESKLVNGTVEKKDRSLMNVPFVTGDAELDAKFVKEAKAAGLENLKGHRSVGGMRASIYNAMPEEGVQALVDFMKKFEEENL